MVSDEEEDDEDELPEVGHETMDDEHSDYGDLPDEEQIEIV